MVRAELGITSKICLVVVTFLDAIYAVGSKTRYFGKREKVVFPSNWLAGDGATCVAK